MNHEDEVSLCKEATKLLKISISNMQRPRSKRDNITIEAEQLPKDAMQEILHIAQKRASLLRQMKAALESDNIDEVRRIAEAMCGMNEEASG